MLYNININGNKYILFKNMVKNYICADLEWQPEELDKAFNQLLELGFIKYDEHHKIILIPKVVVYQTPQNPNQEKSAKRNRQIKIK